MNESERIEFRHSLIYYGLHGLFDEFYGKDDQLERFVMALCNENRNLEINQQERDIELEFAIEETQEAEKHMYEAHEEIDALNERIEVLEAELEGKDGTLRAT